MKKIFLFIILFILLLLPEFNRSKNINYNDKVIALSFDDGPSKYTKKIVDYLKEQNITATFFIVGKNAEIYPKTLLYCFDNGNEIGNHTYDHKWLTKNNVNEVINQISKTEDIIYNITSENSKLYRPSYGAINSLITTKINLQVTLWDVDSNDWKIKNYKTIASNVIRKTKNNDIILMHDTYERSYEALKIIVPQLKKIGYNFITISELNRIKKYKKNI